MFTNEFVDEIVGKYNKSEKDLKPAAIHVASILDKNPDNYYFYGPYWWAVKSLLKKYVTGDKWYLGGYFDQIAYERAWHDTELRTISAAFHYQTEEIMRTPHHSIILDGEEVSYTLYDEDAEF